MPNSNETTARSFRTSINDVEFLCPSVLYRFSKRRHLNAFVERGVISFGSANIYEDTRLSDGQRDNERQRIFIPSLKGLRFFFTPTGQSAQPLSSICRFRFTVDLPNYYLFCFTRTYDPMCYSTWDADSCVEVINPAEFLMRLINAGKDTLSGWGLYCGEVRYFNTSEMPQKADLISFAFSKNAASFRHQDEFRIILTEGSNKCAAERKDITIGPLRDICKFVC